MTCDIESFLKIGEKDFSTTYANVSGKLLFFFICLVLKNLMKLIMSRLCNSTLIIFETTGVMNTRKRFKKKTKMAANHRSLFTFLTIKTVMNRIL